LSQGVTKNHLYTHALHTRPRYILSLAFTNFSSKLSLAQFHLGKKGEKKPIADTIFSHLIDKLKI